MSELESILERPIREALPLIRQHLQTQIDAGESPTEALGILAAREPIALGELVVGPKAIPGSAMVLSALSEVEVLEKSIAPKALYQRLIDLGPDAGIEVLEVAVRRHPEAPWLVALSTRVEGPDAGLRQLRAVADRPCFIALCEAYAQAGSTEALVRLAGNLPRLEPVLALARQGSIAIIARAAAALLCADPEQPVLAWIAAIRGPDLDELVLAMIPHMRSSSGLRSLRAQARACAGGLSLLDKICGSLSD
jgi:hypothetical protein